MSMLSDLLLFLIHTFSDAPFFPENNTAIEFTKLVKINTAKAANLCMDQDHRASATLHL